MKPTVLLNRINVIDLIRGFALMGLPFVNILALWSFSITLSNQQYDVYAQRFLYLFVEGRFYAIFSFLFGLGVWIFLSRAIEKHERPYMIYVRRMLILLLIGIIHQFFQPGEALMIYAIFSFLILGCIKLPKQVNLVLGVVGIIIGSVVGAKILLPLPFMLLGLAFGQYQLFENRSKYRNKWIATMMISCMITIGLSIYLWQQAPEHGLRMLENAYINEELQLNSNIQFYEFANLAMTYAPVFSIFYVSFLVVIEPFMYKILQPLNAFGRMAFTNYIGQTAILLVVIALWPTGEMISYTMTMIVCAAVVITQIVFSVIWLKVFKYGPLEWLWRCGTYGQWLALKKND